MPLQFGIGLHLDGDLVLEPFRADALAGERSLGFGQRYAVADDAVMLGRVDQHGAPAAADVEQRLAGLQAQLAADMVELVELRLVDPVREILEVAAAVDHALVEEEPVEVVRNIVVVGDRLLVGAADERVAPGKALDAGIAAAGEGERGKVAQQFQLGKMAQLRLQFSLRAAFDDVEQRAVLDIDGLGNPEFDQRREDGTPEHAADYAAVVDDEHGSVGRADALAVPQPHREAGLQLLDHGPDESWLPCPSCPFTRPAKISRMMAARLRRDNPLLPRCCVGDTRPAIFLGLLSFPDRHPIIVSCSTKRKEVIRCRVVSVSRTWLGRIVLSGSSLPDSGMKRGR